MKLSAIQEEIVNSDAKKIIVDAGSGSGKTRTLTERVIKLLNDGANPKSIVVITFTNMAADELKSRLDGIKGSDDCFIGTIHSYANKLLRSTKLQYDIMTEEHELEFMKILISKYAKSCTVDDYLKFVKYRDMANRGLMNKDDIAFKLSNYSAYNEILILIGDVYSQDQYETVKTLAKLNNVIGFDDLIKLSTKYFDENKTNLKYLFVDEFQDIGYSVFKFLLKLNAENYFVIGDDYQSIYQFNGGDVGIFLSLMNDPEWKTYYLTENYRTCKRIMDYANRVIKRASDIIVKDVKCMREDAGDFKISSKYMFDDFISGLHDTDNWFILVRSNKELIEVDKKLSAKNIKHRCIRQSQYSAKKLQEIMQESSIKVMTVHSSKGLECENVALYGKFPVSGDAKSEEIKVYYVGITRARTRCYLFV